jgi:hypothetical protein
MLLRLVLLFLLAPALARAGVTVLVDAVPTLGQFYGMSPVGLPFRDAQTVKPEDISSGLSRAVAGMIPSAEQAGITFICLLSPAGDNPVEAYIAPAKAFLRLRRRNTTLTAVFYRGGEAPQIPMIYSVGNIDRKKPNVSAKIDKIAVPAGVTTAGWIYFNLPRIQDAANKAGSAIVFLKVAGTGASSLVAIPGLKEPLTVYDDHAALTASWYMRH